MTLPLHAPMLATSALAGFDWRSGWAFEPKLDGWRVLVGVDADARLSVRTRSGRLIQDEVPELAALAEAVPAETLLDGELVAGDGRPQHFYRLHPGGRARGERLTFVAFDVLHVDGASLLQESYSRRRQALGDLGLQGPSWAATASFQVGLEAAFVAAAEHGLEGLVAKRLAGTYRPGKRSPDWVKLKTVSWRDHHGRQRGPHRRQQ